LLANKTPDQIYQSAEGDGDMIVDKFAQKNSTQRVSEEPGQRCAAVRVVESTT